MTEEQRSYLAQRIAGRSRTRQECSLRIGRESSSQQVQRERSRGKVGETHMRICAGLILCIQQGCRAFSGKEQQHPSLSEIPTLQKQIVTCSRWKTGQFSTSSKLLSLPLVLIRLTLIIIDSFGVTLFPLVCSHKKTSSKVSLAKQAGLIYFLALFGRE